MNRVRSAPKSPTPTLPRCAWEEDSIEQLRHFYDRTRDIAHATVALHRHATQRVIRLVFAQAARFHQQSLRALDEFPLGQFLLCDLEFGTQRRDGSEARARNLKNRGNALGRQAITDIPRT